MGLVDAVGAYAKARDNLRASLAASSTFQSWVDAADPTLAKALARIHLSGTPAPTNGETYSVVEVTAMTPLAIIRTKTFVTRANTAVGAGACYERGSDLIVDLLGPVDEATAAVPAECGRLIDNVVSGIITDLEALNGQPGYLAWRQIAIQEEPERGEVGELPTRGDQWQIRMIVTWMGI